MRHVKCNSSKERNKGTVKVKDLLSKQPFVMMLKLRRKLKESNPYYFSSYVTQ